MPGPKHVSARQNDEVYATLCYIVLHCVCRTGRRGVGHSAVDHGYWGLQRGQPGHTSVPRNDRAMVRGSHLDLNHAPYVSYAVKHIDLVSLAPFLGFSSAPSAPYDTNTMPLWPYQVSVRRLLPPLPSARAPWGEVCQRQPAKPVYGGFLSKYIAVLADIFCSMR